MSYVLESTFANVNFMQNNQIAKNTQAIDLHSNQLMELGRKQIKIGQDLTYFGNKVTELDATNQAQYGNIEQLYLNHADQETQLNQAKAERDSIQQKLNTHSHSNGGNCGMFDIPCHLRNLTGQIGTVALLAGGGFVLYKVLSKKKGFKIF